MALYGAMVKEKLGIKMLENAPSMILLISNYVKKRQAKRNNNSDNHDIFGKKMFWPRILPVHN